MEAKGKLASGKPLPLYKYQGTTSIPEMSDPTTSLFVRMFEGDARTAATGGTV